MNVREARRWLTYARSDVEAAQALLDVSQSYSWQACFLTQQAAEKSIKAILVFSELESPYIHDLDRLRDLLPNGWRIKAAFPDLAELTIWAVEARCPDDMPDIVETDARKALAMAKGIYQLAVEDIERRIL